MSWFAGHGGRAAASSYASYFAVPPLLMLWCHDCIASVHVVRGSSMEPTLREGDVIMVQRSDLFLEQRGIDRRRVQQSQRYSYPEDEDDGEEDEINDKDLRRTVEMDSSVGKVPSWILSTPPIVLRGDVVVLRSPQSSSEYLTKRVVGLGGQTVRPRTNLWRTEYIPPYSLWVESDNRTKDRSFADSATVYGPITKKLLIGRVDRIVWPPSRWASSPFPRPKEQNGNSAPSWGAKSWW